MGDPYAILAELQKAQWLPAKVLDDRAFRRFGAILRHAFRNVPFYSKLYRNVGVDPSRVKTLRHLNQLPVVTKAMMRAAGRHVLAQNIPADRFRVAYTSGSTGDPFRFYLDHNWEPWRLASKWLLDSFFQARPQSRYFNFLYAKDPNHPATHLDATPLLDKLRILLKIRFENNYTVYSPTINEATLPSLLKAISAFRPKYGSAQASVLVLLVQLMESAGVSEFPRISAMVSGAETLLETERRKIEETIGCPIFERYGSREFYGAVAGECASHTGLHVNQELVILEIVDDNGEPCAQSEVGRILVTDLHNLSMPFIRYEIGDLAAWGEPCNCGRGFPGLREIVGRVTDFAETKKGERIPVRVLGTILMVKGRLAEWIRFYQFIQDRPGHLILRAVPDRPAPANLPSLVEAKLAQLEKIIHVDFDLELTAQLETYSSGKRAILLRRPA